MQSDIAMRTAEIYSQRREKVRGLLAARNLDALLVALPANRFYLSGFELHDGQPNETSGFLLITRDGDDWLATDSRYEEAAARLWPQDRIYIYRAPGDVASLVARCAAVSGIEAKSVSWQFARELGRAGIPLIPVDNLVEQLREIKEESEIGALEESFRLNQKMLDWLAHELESGNFSAIAEKDISWEIEKFFRANGAQELAFSTIAATGRNAALPHAIPGNDTLKPDSLILIDAGCRVDNYCSDQTRTFWIGDAPSRKFTETLRLVREAQEAALAIMRPGVACADVYRAARAVFEAAGVEKAFTHGLGHGVGLETHELPSLSPRSIQTLKKGMVVTVEPGLYYPEWGGVRWENTVLIEEHGARIL